MGVKKFVANAPDKKLDKMLTAADGVMTAGCGRTSAGMRNQLARQKKR